MQIPGGLLIFFGDEKMARVVIEGISIEQAEEFAHWFEGQGEQDMYNWFETNDVETFDTDVARKGGFMEKTKDEVTVYCKRHGS